ncbi:MAG: cysteine peptidase family C39 domain-containing protein [Eubacteriales bacterium]
MKKKNNRIKHPLTKGVADVPVVMQMEALECGAASLCMVAAYYGKWIPLEQVRADCGVSRDGSNAKNLLVAARSYGFTAKGYRYESEDLKKHGKFPCIIHWNFNHFVVLDGFKGKKAVINDPAKGTYSVPMDIFDKSFTGICLMFEPGEDFEPSGKRKSVFAFAMSGSFTVGMIYVFQGLLSSFSAPAMMMISAGQTIQEMRTQMERVDDVMQYPTDVCYDTKSEDENFQKLKGSIELKNITFGYSKLSTPVIKDFSMSVKPGGRVALVGSSGCGKSTISKLISGLYQPWSGEFLYDGKHLNKIDRSIFTGSLAVVDQEITLFEDTISNNIKMWDTSIEDFEMVMRRGMRRCTRRSCVATAATITKYPKEERIFPEDSVKGLQLPAFLHRIPR